MKNNEKKKRILSPSFGRPPIMITLLTTIGTLTTFFLEGTTVVAHTTTTTTTSDNSNKPWLQEQFPNPSALSVDGASLTTTTCYPASSAAYEEGNTNIIISRSHRICDPDQVLSLRGFQKVDTFLRTNQKYINVVVDKDNDYDYCKVYGSTTEPGGAVSDSNNQKNEEEEEAEEAETTTTTTTNEEDEPIELQMGVALVKKMDLTPFSNSGGGGEVHNNIEDRAAETFARYVHDEWGVGIQTANGCGGTGILLFLSIMDRTIYISRGSALTNTLTDQRLDRIMDNMREDLRAGDYDTAILGALQDIHYYIDQGPQSHWEQTFASIIENWLVPMIWLLMVLAPMFRNSWINRRRHREYAQVRSQLNEIDRAKAEALQGKYNCTSCPICLEDFATPTTEATTTAAAAAAAAEGTEGKSESDERSNKIATHGSDGLPIKLLRCGHCMDETCWAEWINSGRGTITKCPICMQDVGEEIEPANNDNNNDEQQQQQQQPGRLRVNDLNENGANNNLANFNNNGNDEDNNNRQQEEDRIMRQYRRERNFRLARLGVRYPRIVQPAQIQRWSNPTYDGQLVRDPGFVQSNPALATPAPRGGGGIGSSRSGGGFGGSSSGGGRGGRW